MRLILFAATVSLTSGIAAAADDLVADPVFSPALRAVFDRPQNSARTLLPARERGDPRGVVRCFRYPAFLVKEVDHGEHGDDHVSVTPLASTALTPACTVAALPGEVTLAASEESYFLGASGRYGFVLSTEGQDGVPVTIHDLTNGRNLYADTMEIESGRFAATLANGGLRVEYSRSVGADCSIVSGGAACWRHFADQAQLPSELASRPAPVAACRAGYAAVRIARPADPSVLHYRVTLSIDAAGKPSIHAGAIVACAPQS